ncbi:hypothetical protein D0Y65_004755 [Glycine soja]|uniref:Uncharacterized protein n=2 Tax=Glycine subgen. Soja TaxID=1462606 RepID=A0A0R0LA49_SOYBN|nr:hypothetical protein D0Y65_004755 [Glycine soja]
MVNWRKRNNMIRGVHADGVWKEEPLERFNEDHWDRPNLDGVAFEKISSDDNDMLLGSFGKEEIVEAIWDCRSSKSLNPDGYNFKFKKEFWTLMKEDFLSLLPKLLVLELLLVVTLILIILKHPFGTNGCSNHPTSGNELLHCIASSSSGKSRVCCRPALEQKWVHKILSKKQDFCRKHFIKHLVCKAGYYEK